MSVLKSVTIGIPSMGSVKTFTMSSIIDIIAKDPSPKSFSYPVHTYTHEARRICVEEAMNAGSSHLFFLDSDMAVRGTVIQQLAKHHKPVVGALYNERRLPLTNTVKFWDNGSMAPRTSSEMPKTLFQCYAIATGCMLIDMKVFEKVEKPWFFYSYFPDGSMDYGEDVWFCDRVNKAGFSVWCDPTIEIKHIGDFAY